MMGGDPLRTPIFMGIMVTSLPLLFHEIDDTNNVFVRTANTKFICSYGKQNWQPNT